MKHKKELFKRSILFIAIALTPMLDELIEVILEEFDFKTFLYHLILTLVIAVVLFLVLKANIRNMKEYERDIEYYANHDSLTGLPHRRLLKGTLDKLIDITSGNNSIIAVMFLDLDNFKLINDSLGHESGDHLLREISKKLKNYIIDFGEIFRLGGDEFTIILSNTNCDLAAKAAQDIINILRTPFIIDDNEIFISASIGISISPLNGTDANELIRKADIAMYFMKKQGKGSYKFYSDDIDYDFSRQIKLENDLRRAIERNELMIYYQPKVSLKTRERIGAEALLRWNHSEYGIISPTEFIPLAEKTGLIIPIGEWVMRKVCMQNKAWQDTGFSPITISVNLSERQIMQPDFVNAVSNVLEETKLNPEYLELEITENVAQTVQCIGSIFDELNEMGVKISVDDFGSGYSSLNYLRDIPLNTLKIDKSFIKGISKEPRNKSIIESIIIMGKKLNITVLVEGVETEQELSFLKGAMCDEVQGYYFSQPIPSEEFEEQLANKEKHLA